MDLNRLRHVLAVAETGSFSRAAEEVHITQPALSRSIAAFERDHGVRLFDRGRGGVSVTPAGSLVVERARAILAAAGDLERSLRLFGQGEAGRVAIGLGPMLASLLLPEVGRALLRKRPHLQISTRVRAPAVLLQDLAAGEVEMIFGSAWQLEKTSATERRILGSLELATVVRSGHPLAALRGISEERLAAFPEATAIDLPARAGETAGTFVCENFHILKEVVLGTDCVWRTSPAFVAHELRQRRMTILDVADPIPRMTDVCVLAPHGRMASSAAAALIDEVTAVLAHVG